MSENMPRGCLKIGRPEVVTEGDKSVLRAQIDDDGVKKTLSFKVDARWGEYLTWERSDAFLMGLLYYAMIKDKDIEWETPCNEQLIYQLQTYYIPVCTKEMAFIHDIELRGPTTTKILPCENGVATGLSNGVDSSYTIHKYLTYERQEYRLTHVLFTDWFIANFSEDRREDYRKNYLATLPRCAEELGLEFIYVEFYPDVDFSIGIVLDKVCGTIMDSGLYTFKYCSLCAALQKLIHIYYFSSGFAPRDLDFHTDDLSHHDVFTVPLMSTPALRFYSAGMEEPTRVDKTIALADWPYAHRHLHVCNDYNDTNCGHCRKCHYTMGTLYALGKLDDFSEVFPVDDFKRHLPQRYAYLLAKGTSGNVHCKEVTDWMREKNIKVPTLSYILSPFYWVREVLNSRLRTKPWARKLYKKFGLHKVLYSHDKFSHSTDYMDSLVLHGEKKEEK